MARPCVSKRCEEIESECAAPFFTADVVAAEFAVEVGRKSNRTRTSQSLLNLSHTIREYIGVLFAVETLMRSNHRYQSNAVKTVRTGTVGSLTIVVQPSAGRAFDPFCSLADCDSFAHL